MDLVDYKPKVTRSGRKINRPAKLTEVEEELVDGRAQSGEDEEESDALSKILERRMADQELARDHSVADLSQDVNSTISHVHDREGSVGNVLGESVVGGAGGVGVGGVSVVGGAVGGLGGGVVGGDTRAPQQVTGNIRNGLPPGLRSRIVNDAASGDRYLLYRSDCEDSQGEWDTESGGVATRRGGGPGAGGDAGMRRIAAGPGGDVSDGYESSGQVHVFKIGTSSSSSTSSKGGAEPPVGASLQVDNTKGVTSLSDEVSTMTRAEEIRNIKLSHKNEAKPSSNKLKL